jgi:hypothetical protein
MKIIEDLRKIYTLKGVGVPEYFLGGNVETLGPEWEKEEVFTALSARTYIENVVKKMADMCGKKDFKMYKTPMSEDYHPEEDETPLLGKTDISKYQAMIGTGNWIVTLGRYDIAYAINTMARYAASPREGHYKALMRVFGYLYAFPKGRIIVDNSCFD